MYPMYYLFRYDLIAMGVGLTLVLVFAAIGFRIISRYEASMPRPLSFKRFGGWVRR